METSTPFDQFAERAAGYAPYPYQRRLAAEGLPEVLRVPTGTGKTLAATLPWLYRRRFHPDPEIRSATPHWLVYVLPMRALVEQTVGVVGKWLDQLGLQADVVLHVVMGGEGRLESLWRTFPEKDTIFVGTLDMLLSRALNRGYADNHSNWPIDFGLFNAGCQWVFDEVQLMGPALPTSRQLEGLRHSFGTAMPCRSMWMSATVDLKAFATPDLPEPDVGSAVGLADDDRRSALHTRLEAVKQVRRLVLGTDATYPRALAAALLGHHRPGTRTIAILNTVDRARELYLALKDSKPDVVLLHSRFRPPDRRAHTDQALARVDPSGPGRIVVATQVLEAGVDVSSATLFTEAAPWPSVVQRAGRCNREGEVDAAVLLWALPPKPEPYEQADVDASVEALARLEGRSVTATGLGAEAVPTTTVVHPVLRRRDLLDLFDTTPDLAGNDVDVGRFLREGDDLDVQWAWWDVGDEGPAEDRPSPGRDERCPVSIGQARKALGRAGGQQAWRFDHLDERRWVRCRPADVRPGRVLVLRADQGGYRTETGWDPSSRQPVVPVPDQNAGEEAEPDDRLTMIRRWVSLADHLAHVEAEVRRLASGLRPPGLSPERLEAAAVAGRLHDIGKAHEVFQATCKNTAITEEERAVAESIDSPWAKSGGSGRFRHSRRNFRHELASALALLGDASIALREVPEPDVDLVIYLVAAHHGRVRLGIRSLPGEAACSGEARAAVLGVCDGEELPGLQAPGGPLPATALDLSVMELGDGPGGSPSWTQRAMTLRDRDDLGPFRLAFLEALVRLADWRASAAEERGEL